jgi:hypothetical protein
VIHQQPDAWSAADPVGIDDDDYDRAAATVAAAANTTAWQCLAGFGVGLALCLAADLIRGTHHLAALIGLAS